MPTYSYACPKCGHEYEKFQKITDRTRTKCPKCGTRGERRITGGAGLVFKGSGFYITDYKRGDKARSSEKPDAAAEKADKPAKKDGASDSGAKPASEKGAES
jgi:putative FmdB family regulatory protein